jgi:hypothetical protein
MKIIFNFIENKWKIGFCEKSSWKEFCALCKKEFWIISRN